MSEKVAYEWNGRNHGLNSLIGVPVNIKVYESLNKRRDIKIEKYGKEKEGTLVKLKELKPLDTTLLGFWNTKVYRLSIYYRTVGYYYGEGSNGKKSYYNDHITLFSRSEDKLKDLKKKLSRFLGKKLTKKSSKKTNKNKKSIKKTNKNKKSSKKY